MHGDIQPAADTQRALRTTEEWPRLHPLRISPGNSLGPWGTLFHWVLFSAPEVCGARSGCGSTQAYYPCHSAVLLLRVTRGKSKWVWWRYMECTGLQIVASCWGCTIWSIEPRVSARRGKCAQAKWTYSTWRAYRSVFTCLLSQVVQTGSCLFTLTVASGHCCFLQNGTNSRE